MSIARFSFQDRFRGWKLNEVSFSDFNLLVGISGAGKTQILDALRAIRNAAVEDSRFVNQCQWEVELAIGEDNYRWSAETSPGWTSHLALLSAARNGNDPSEAEKPRFIKELITKNEEEIAKRLDDAIIFRGNLLPKLKNSESVITLLGNEEVIAPLHRFFNGVFFSGAGESSPAAYGAQTEMIPWAQGVQWSKQFTDLDSLRLQITQAPVLLMAYVLQENFPAEFDRLKQDYLEIFPTVLDVKIDRLIKMAPAMTANNAAFLMDNLVLGLKEEGVEGWILSGQISRGMLRTMIHLFEIALAPPDAVIVIDEFENSLGTNCLPELTDHLLRATTAQVVLTSHHPYIINNVPFRYWKLVIRNGSEVTVKDATSIRELDAASSLEKFTRLLNLEEYAEAIR
jgi:AAA15 family ATPase/GTPase